MPDRFFSIQFIVLILFLNGCTPGTRNQLIEKEQYPLTAEQLFTTVADNSLHLASIDFDAILYFQQNGVLSAIDRLDNMDTGKWDITNENEICLKFRIWYYGDSKCYSVFHAQKPDSFIFFTKNGAKYYSAEYMAGDPRNLAKQIHNTEKKKYLRNDLANKAQGGQGLNSTQAQSAPDIIQLARNCPGCNLAGSNLNKAHLVGANLAGANLSGADLSEANLRRADLTGADLSGAKCITTNLAGATLIDSNLSGADLTGSNLIKAKLNGATTEGTIFTGAHLEGIEGYK